MQSAAQNGARAGVPEGGRQTVTWMEPKLNAPNCFPAARCNPVSHSRSAPPRWPVSGLAETTRVSFPGSQASQWIRHERRTGVIPVRLPLRGQLRLGLRPRRRRPFLIPVELRLHECGREHQRRNHSLPSRKGVARRLRAEIAVSRWSSTSHVQLQRDGVNAATPAAMASMRICTRRRAVYSACSASRATRSAHGVGAPAQRVDVAPRDGERDRRREHEGRMFRESRNAD